MAQSRSLAASPCLPGRSDPLSDVLRRTLPVLLLESRNENSHQGRAAHHAPFLSPQGG